VTDDLPAAITAMSCTSTPTTHHTRTVDLHEPRWNCLIVAAQDETAVSEDELLVPVVPQADDPGAHGLEADGRRFANGARLGGHRHQ
jgi:hypothetical protein